MRVTRATLGYGWNLPPDFASETVVPTFAEGAIPGEAGGSPMHALFF